MVLTLYGCLIYGQQLLFMEGPKKRQHVEEILVNPLIKASTTTQSKKKGAKKVGCGQES